MMTQREPDGRVTVTPELKVIGPAEDALEPAVIVYDVETVWVFS
jgi:hypothetical protein